MLMLHKNNNNALLFCWLCVICSKQFHLVTNCQPFICCQAQKLLRQEDIAVSPLSRISAGRLHHPAGSYGSVWQCLLNSAERRKKVLNKGSVSNSLTSGAKSKHWLFQERR